MRYFKTAVVIVLAIFVIALGYHYRQDKQKETVFDDITAETDTYNLIEEGTIGYTFFYEIDVRGSLDEEFLRVILPKGERLTFTGEELGMVLKFLKHEVD